MTVLRVNKIAASGQTSENTGSVYFDGSGDYLEIADTDDLTFGSGDYTIEAWIYIEDGTQEYQGIFGSSGTGSDSIQFQLRDEKLRLSSYTTELIVADAADAVTVGQWTHIAISRNGTGATDTRIFKDGRLIKSGQDNITWGSYDRQIGRIFSNADYDFQGYISNLRIIKGTALYTSNFTPPTTELEVTPETVLVACYDGENIFAEKTGKIIAAIGDRLSSPTPTATDSPIGITTNYPAVTRSVDVTAGPVLQGNLEYNSQNFLVLPKGTTAERGGDRGFNAGGGYPTGNNIIDYINISSTGNALDFGDLTIGRGLNQGFASNTRGVTLGGTGTPSTDRNNIDYVTMSSTGDAVDFGDMQNAVVSSAGLSNRIRGVMNRSNAASVSLDYVTIATLGDAVDFGGTTGLQGNQMSGQIASPIRGIFSGGAPSSNAINYITIATTGDAQDFGDLNRANEHAHSGGSNTIRGIYGGGNTAPTSIDYITISTLGDALDFGDLTAATRNSAGCASLTRVVIAGRGISTSNAIDYVQIMSTGNAIDFGDATSNTPGAGFSNAHGGLG